METKEADAVRIELHFTATLNDVYRAWTDPDLLTRWAWGSLSRDVTAEADVRPEGAYRITTSRPDGTQWTFSGTYVHVMPNRKLEYSVEWSAPMDYETPGETVTVEFSGDERNTTVVFVHRGVPIPEAREEHIKGWNNTFEILRRLLEES